MKKLLSIALVLVFALSLAAPALAYTTVVAGGATFSVDIYLVDYSATIALFGGAPALSLPATNRAYGVNEVVAAVANFTVPANVDILETYGQAVFTTENISMNVTDNRVAGVFGFVNDVNRNVSAPAVTGSSVYDDVTRVADDEYEFTFGSIVANAYAGNYIGTTFNRTQTYSFLVFGKVIDEDASMTITLDRGAEFTAFGAANANWGNRPVRLDPNTNAAWTGFSNVAWATMTNAPDAFMELNNDYIVYRNNFGVNGARTYYVSDNPNTGQPALLLAIEVGSNNAANGVLYYDNATPYRFFMTASGDVAINNALNGQLASVATNAALYNRLLTGFTNLFDDLGLTLSNRTNIMTNGFWEDLANVNNISETVSVDPLALPYIQVPEVEVTEPPKTGSAASILGFVIIAMAGVAAVVVRKVRA